MKHKWHKEIKAWADGAEIEESLLCEVNHGEFDWSEWRVTTDPTWETIEYMYRIKPQPKEPQYLYVYKGQGYEYNFSTAFHESCTFGSIQSKYIGKIKLDSDNA